MESDTPDIVVLRSKAHGISSVACADALRSNLPEYDIRVASTPQEEAALIEHAPIAVGLDIDVDLLARASSLKLFACASAGVGHLPLAELAASGVAVTNASGIHAPNIAEHVLGNLLVFSRRLHEGWRRQQNNEWRRYPARELNGSTVTVVGMGAIGERTLELLEPFDVERIGIRHSPEKGGPADEVRGYDSNDVHTALARTDYLVLACPLTETTEGLIDEEAFETLPPEAVVVNVARGPVVDTDALLAAIQSNAIRGAALDVTDPEPLPHDHPLWGFENVLITPHYSGHTERYWERRAEILVRNVEQIENEGYDTDLENQVVTPET
ncbi:D-2-hydroxyacid dehydrogenase (plasmid) [Haloferacaceae archaeon DSL9]